MASQRGLDRDARGIGVADLAHKDHIGVLTKHGLEGRREGEFLIGLGLNNSRNPEFDGVLDRDDLHFRGVQLLQDSIESGGLAGAGGTSDKEQTLLLRNHMAN